MKKKFLKFFKLILTIVLSLSLINISCMQIQATDNNDNTSTQEVVEENTTSTETNEETKETTTEGKQEATVEKKQEETTQKESEESSTTETKKTVEEESIKDVVLQKTIDGIVIKVAGKSNVIDENTTLEVKKVSTSKVEKAIEKSLDDYEKLDKVLAYDITLKVDGKEIQPNDGSVKVEFSKLPFTTSKSKEVSVAHISDNLKKVEDIDSNVKNKGKRVSIEAKHFSIYAIYEIQDTLPEINKTTYQKVNTFSYEGLSSLAFDFHIFADDVTFNVHTNGNVAANTLNVGSNFGTNQNKSDKISEYNYVGKSLSGFKGISSGVLVVGKNVSVTKNGNQLYLGDNSQTININPGMDSIYYQESDSTSYIDINKELSNLEALSVKFAQNKSTEGIWTKTTDQNNASIIDLKDSTAAINFVNVTASEITTLNGYSMGKPRINVKNAEDKTVIINIDMTNANEYTLSNLVTSIDGYTHSEEVVRSNCNVLFNLYEYDNNGNIQSYHYTDTATQVGTGDYFLGTILAPRANIAYKQLNGTLIAKKATNVGGESHKWDFTGLSSSIKVNKTLDDNSATNNKTFYFGVFTKDGNSYTRVSNTRIKSISLKGGETKSITFTNLKLNQNYYIFETDSSGNRLSSNGDYTIVNQGALVNVTSTSQNEITIVNKVKDEKGSLTIKKNVTLNGASTESTKVDGTYYFTVKDSNNKYYYLEDGEIKSSSDIKYITLEVKNGNSTTKTISGLTPGEYIVSEATTKNPTGISLIGNNDVKLTVKANDSEGVKTATFTNNKTEEIKGSLEIVKTSEGTTTPSTTTFTITGPNNYSKTVKYSDFKDGKYTLANLELGEYKVVESGADVNSYTLKVTGNTTATLSDNATAKTVELTNTYTKIKGSLEIVKTSEGATTPSTTTFTITGPNNYSKTVKYSDFKDGKYTLTNLELGEYKVVESGADVNGYTLKVTGNTTATLSDNATAKTVELTNTYTKIKGSLEIVKTSEGTTTPSTTTFTITGPNNYSKTVKYSDFKDGKYTLTNLELGEYKVVESGADVNGYTLKVTGNTTATLTANSTNGIIAITNDYTEILGSLVITKTTNGATTPSTTTFTITGPNSYSKTVKYSDFKDGKYTLSNLKLGEYTVVENTDSAKISNYTLVVTGNNKATLSVSNTTGEVNLINNYTKNTGSLIINKTSIGTNTPDDAVFTIEGPNEYNLEVKYSDFTNGSYKLDNLLLGEYTISEKNANINNYKLELTGDKTATISKNGEESIINITNTYTKIKGSLEIVKNSNGTKTPDNTIFTITGPNYSNTVKYSDFKDGKYTLTNLELGEYKVVESGADVNGYTLKVTGNTTAKLTSENTSGTIEITNDYTKILGSLTIEKVTNGTKTPDSTVFTVTGPNNYSQEVKYSEFKDGKYTLTNLELGEYKVVESGATVKGYTLNVSGNNTVVNIKSSITENVVIVNDYTETKVSITKTDANGNILAGAKLQVLDSDKNVVKEFTSTNSAYNLYSELEAGKTYILHEVKAPKGYNLADDVEFTVNSDGTLLSVNMVDLKISNLVVYKVDQNMEPLEGASFTLYKQNESGDYTLIQTIDNGPTFEFNIVEDGHYKMVESVVPTGYIGVDSFEFDIVGGVAYYDGEPQEDFTIVNSKLKTDVHGDKVVVDDDSDGSKNKDNVKGVVISDHRTKTSDNTNIALYGTLIAISLIAVFVVIRKKHS